MNNRRDFIKHTLIATAIAATGIPKKVFGTMIPATSGNGEVIQGVYSVYLGDPNNAALLSDNGSLTLQIPGMTDYPGYIHVTRVAGPKYYSVLDYCTHAGCGLNDFNGSYFYCGCHGSEFSATGSVIRGPARSALKTYPTVLDSANNRLQITIAGATAVHEVVPASTALRSIYPNPASVVTIVEYNLQQAATVALTVFSISGEEIFQSSNAFRDAGAHQEPIDVSRLHTGMYFIKMIVSTGETMIQKFSVVR